MKSKRTLLYLNANLQNNELLCTGISFAEFTQSLSKPIENLMTITGGSEALLVETRNERGLELFEGTRFIRELAEKDLYALGNFCFVDYAKANLPFQLREEQIAELLYLGHMFRPLHSPFFEELQNRFAYLSHDDGFFCKIYYKNIMDLYGVLSGKLKQCFAKSVSAEPAQALLEEMFKLSENGLMIDFEKSTFHKGVCSFPIYLVGKFSDMDIVYNNYLQLKEEAKRKFFLTLQEDKWRLIET